ncbi:MAG: Clp protease N-terminal domain-containing protein [Pirellulaceae bacterium]
MSVSRRRFIGTSFAVSALAATPALGSASGDTALPKIYESVSSSSNSTRTQQVMQLASQYALQMNHWHLGTEHLFFAIAKESERTNTQWMDDLGLSSEEIDCVVNYVVGRGQTSGRTQPVDSDLLASDNLKACLEQAEQAASELGHDQVQPEHLMLGIIDSFGTTANMLLNEMWIERGSIRHVALNALGT